MSALVGVEDDIVGTNSHSKKNCQNLLTEKLRIWSNSIQPFGDKGNNKRSSNNDNNKSMAEPLKVSQNICGKH